jgi:hypothetical protein
MSRAGRAGFVLATSALVIAILGAAAQAQQPRYPKPTELPNPYRLVEGWPTLPKTMNGGHWGEVIRVNVDAKGNLYVTEVQVGKRAQKFVFMGLSKTPPN